MRWVLIGLLVLSMAGCGKSKKMKTRSTAESGDEGLLMKSYNGYVRRARVQEGRALLQDIRFKQESYFSTYSQYVSSAATEDAWYPTRAGAPRGKGKTATWDWSEMDCAAPTPASRGWCDLGFRPEDASPFRFVTVGWHAKRGAEKPHSTYAIVNEMDFKKRWYYIAATADLDGDGEPLTLVMTSQSKGIERYGDVDETKTYRIPDGRYTRQQLFPSRDALPPEMASAFYDQWPAEVEYQNGEPTRCFYNNDTDDDCLSLKKLVRQHTR